jgi:TMEM175 potassium channel family protein
VVAIALTLLILQIAVPTASMLHRHPDSASELASALAKSSDDWISYGVSFYVIAQFWLNHHRVFRQIDKQADGLAAWNFAFLFTISVMPFTSDLLGKFNGNPLAVDIFGFNLFLANLATLLMLEFGDRHELLGPGVKRDRFASRLHILVGIVVALLSIGLAWYSTTLAQCSWFLFAIVPQLADAILRLTGRPRQGRETHI